VIVLDEAHLMLRNSKSEISKALTLLETTRRIALTGTPLQNNLTEYFRMANWIKPQLLGKTEVEFDRIYAKHIMSSLPVGFFHHCYL
jgi:DNA repair and recombination protein RAD54B